MFHPVHCCVITYCNVNLSVFIEIRLEIIFRGYFIPFLYQSRISFGAPEWYLKNSKPTTKNKWKPTEQKTSEIDAVSSLWEVCSRTKLLSYFFSNIQSVYHYSSTIHLFLERWRISCLSSEQSSAYWNTTGHCPVIFVQTAEVKLVSQPFLIGCICGSDNSDCYAMYFWLFRWPFAAEMWMHYFRQGFVSLNKKLINLHYHHSMTHARVVFFWLYDIGQPLLEQYRQFNTISAS